MTRTQILGSAELRNLHDKLRDPIEYRKSGLSLNHVIGCPIDCAYCIRHIYDNYSMKRPHLIMSDEDAVETLIAHKYFVPGVTPVQLFNKATDAFVPSVRPHLHETLKILDGKGFANDVLVISRYRITQQDIDLFNSLDNLRLTFLVTYSGIKDKRIEPIGNHIPIQSLKHAFEGARNFRVILYWRPIVPGLNDTDEEISFALNDLNSHCHATVYTGLFYRTDIKKYFEDAGLPSLYDHIARRKIMPRETEERILEASHQSNASGQLFRKTSCAVRFAWGKPDYNGHVVIKDDGELEICDICPATQLARCQNAARCPSEPEVMSLLKNIGQSHLPFKIDKDKRIVYILDSSSEEEVRYYLQHNLRTQVHNVAHAHNPGRHGRAEIGWEDRPIRAATDEFYRSIARSS